ncbi:MAG: 6-phosphogluconolactonase [Actinomycetota bacterium]|nr:6-phosphogluconolactonase [Actinomycetota bacterium]
MSVEIYSTVSELIARAVAVVSAAAASGPVALSGGDTPRPVYEALASAGIEGDWYQVDERCVPFGDPDSNATMIERAGLRLHRIDTALSPEDAAAGYEAALRDRWSGGRPALALLGIGADGHTASLFPGSPEVDERGHDVVATRDAHAGNRRVTMTLPLLARFEQRVFLVAGAPKADVVARVLSKGEDLPAARVADALWFLDAGAAAGL